MCEQNLFNNKKRTKMEEGNTTADCVLCGCGPAGLATLVFLEQVGALENILNKSTQGNQHSMVVVDPAIKKNLGGGNLGQYVSPSNTSACMFAFNVFRPRDVKAPLKPEPIIEFDEVPAEVPTEVPTEVPVDLHETKQSDTKKIVIEKTATSDTENEQQTDTLSVPIAAPADTLNSSLLSSPLLESLRETPEAQCLTTLGVGFTRLVKVGPWFRLVAKTLIEERFEQPSSKGLIRAQTAVEKIVVREDGKYDVHLESTDGQQTQSVITTNKVILATGGKQREISWMSKYADTKKKVVVMSADCFLKKEGFAKVFQHLRKQCGGQSIKKRMGGKRFKVVVVGSSHSALSVIHTLLGGADGTIDSNGAPMLVEDRKTRKRKEQEAQKEKATQKEKEAKKVKKKKITASQSTKKVSPKKAVSKKRQNKEENTNFSEQDKIDCTNDIDSDADGGILEVALLDTPAPPLSPPGLAMYRFLKEEILMLHRSPVNLFWGNKNEAKKAGYDIDPQRISQDVKGSINVYSGLRGRSKTLWRNIKKGQETRVKTILYPDGEKIEAKVAHTNPDVLIHALGYGFRLPQFVDAATTLPMEVDTDGGGTLKLTDSSQLCVRRWDSQRKEVLTGIVATGLGAGLRTSHPDIGGEKLMKNIKADGVNIYMNQQARVLCRALWSEKKMQVWMDESQKTRVVQKQENEEKESAKRREVLIYGETQNTRIKNRCESPPLPNSGSLRMEPPKSVSPKSVVNLVDAIFPESNEESLVIHQSSLSPPLLPSRTTCQSRVLGAKSQGRKPPPIVFKSMNFSTLRFSARSDFVMKGTTGGLPHI